MLNLSFNKAVKYHVISRKKTLKIFLKYLPCPVLNNITTFWILDLVLAECQEFYYGGCFWLS